MATPRIVNIRSVLPPDFYPVGMIVVPDMDLVVQNGFRASFALSKYMNDHPDHWKLESRTGERVVLEVGHYHKPEMKSDPVDEYCFMDMGIDILTLRRIVGFKPHTVLAVPPAGISAFGIEL